MCGNWAKYCSRQELINALIAMLLATEIGSYEPPISLGRSFDKTLEIFKVNIFRLQVLLILYFIDWWGWILTEWCLRSMFQEIKLYEHPAVTYLLYQNQTKIGKKLQHKHLHGKWPYPASSSRTGAFAASLSHAAVAGRQWPYYVAKPIIRSAYQAINEAMVRNYKAWSCNV